MIKDFRSKYPSFNFVICHVKHRTDFKGTQGTDWGHQHQELKVSFGKTVGYEIYWFREGTFERLGDGGWLNVSNSFASFRGKFLISFLVVILRGCEKRDKEK